MNNVDKKSKIYDEVEIKKQETVRKGKRKTLVRKILSFFAGLIVWYILSHTIMTKVPDPIVTISDSFWAIQEEWFYKSIVYSIFRVFTGFLIGTAIGLPLGLMLGWNRVFQDLIFPTFETLRPIPPVAWVPFSILTFVKLEISIMFLPFLGAFFAVALNAKLGVESIDPSLFRAAKCLGARPRQIFRHVVLPGALPSIFMGLAIGMGMAWITVVAAEMISGEYGIGYMTWQSYNLIRYAECILAMVTIGILGFGSSSIIRMLGNKFLAWKKVYTA
jgi:NitT/TauT family transport system permease protein